MNMKPSEAVLHLPLTNNSFDMKSTEEALQVALDHSFSYLYRLHRSIVQYEEYFYTTKNVEDQPDYGDIVLDERERPVVNYPVDLIMPQMRSKYKYSEYYRKTVNSEIFTTNRLFGRMPIITIDNQVLKSFNVDIYEDYFTAHLPFDRYFLYEKKYNKKTGYDYIEHNMSVQVFTDTSYKDAIVNTGMLRANSYDGNSFDRVKRSYLSDVGFNIEIKENGTYFAVAFMGENQLGTSLQDVTIDENGDFVISYDENALNQLNNFVGDVTIRFYFIKNLFRYDSRHKNGFVPVRYINGGANSEVFMFLQDGGFKPLDIPIPTENLIIFRSRRTDLRMNNIVKRDLIPNESVHLDYPSTYRVLSNVENGDQLRVYYFINRPYELRYSYMYQFFFNYLHYKWTDFGLEELVNYFYFGDYVSDGTELHNLLERVCKKTHKYLIGEPYEASRKEEEFIDVFWKLILHPITEYRYDEQDYLKNFDGLTSFEYKVNKLKSFIKDDYRVLSRYVDIQNKVGIKYEFDGKTSNLPSKYRTKYEGSKRDLPCPMYIFPISKPNDSTSISARIWLDGLLCTSYVYEKFVNTDYVYIPVDEVTDDTHFEIEVFPAITQTEDVVFTTDKKSVEFSFNQTEYITPTLSDINFLIKNEDGITESLPLEDFKIEVLDKRYNYYPNDELKPVEVYRKFIMNTKCDFYYFPDGKYFSPDGQPDYTKDVTPEFIEKEVAAGRMVKDTAYLTDNSFEVIRDTDVVDWKRVFAGETTIQKDNTKMSHTFVDRVRITVLNDEHLEKEIQIKVAKEPIFERRTIPSIDFPYFSVPATNYNFIDEYIRVFRNGRMICKNRYDRKIRKDSLRVQVLEAFNEGDKVALDVTPYRNRMIYYADEVPSGIIDLRGYIDKPFDPEHYEVYVNGRRLNKTNIFPISPYEFKLAGLRSLDNIEIYQRDRDWEFYGIEFENYFTLSDFIRLLFMERPIAEKLIHDVTGDIPGNIDVEPAEPWDISEDINSIYFEIFYYNRLMPLEHLNPDLLQINAYDIEDNFEIIHELFDTRGDDGSPVLLLNPDLYYEGTYNKWDVYLLAGSGLDEGEEVFYGKLSEKGHDTNIFYVMRLSDIPKLINLPW